MICFVLCLPPPAPHLPCLLHTEWHSPIGVLQEPQPLRRPECSIAVSRLAWGQFIKKVLVCQDSGLLPHHHTAAPSGLLMLFKLPCGIKCHPCRCCSSSIVATQICSRKLLRFWSKCHRCLTKPIAHSWVSWKQRSCLKSSSTWEVSLTPWVASLSLPLSVHHPQQGDSSPPCWLPQALSCRKWTPSWCRSVPLCWLWPPLLDWCPLFLTPPLPPTPKASAAAADLPGDGSGRSAWKHTAADRSHWSWLSHRVELLGEVEGTCRGGPDERTLMKDHPLLRHPPTPLRQPFFVLFFETTLHVQCKSIPPWGGLVADSNSTQAFAKVFLSSLTSCSFQKVLHLCFAGPVFC